MSNLLVNETQSTARRSVDTRVFEDLSPEIVLMEVVVARIEAIRRGAKADVAPIPRTWRRRLANVSDA